MVKRKRVRFVKERPPAPDAVETAWRLFIAVPMPESVTALIDHVVKELDSEGWPVRWAAPDSAHLTLHFLGDTEPERAELLRMALPPVVARHAAFEMRTSHLGVFPNPRQPRVIWLGLDGPTGQLESLQRDLARTLKSLDFPVEDRPFRPHLTIGRVRDDPPPDFAAAVQRRIQDDAFRECVADASASLPIEDVHLIRSILGRSGARHEQLGTFALARKARGS